MFSLLVTEDEVEDIDAFTGFRTSALMRRISVLSWVATSVLVTDDEREWRYEFSVGFVEGCPTVVVVVVVSKATWDDVTWEGVVEVRTSPAVLSAAFFFSTTGAVGAGLVASIVALSPE